MRTKLLKKIRYHYHYYFNTSNNTWMLLSNNKWGHNVPAGLSCAETHTGILHAIEQFKGLRFTAKLQHKNASKNNKTNSEYIRNNDLFLMIE